MCVGPGVGKQMQSLVCCLSVNSLEASLHIGTIGKNPRDPIRLVNGMEWLHVHRLYLGERSQPVDQQLTLPTLLTAHLYLQGQGMGGERGWATAVLYNTTLLSQPSYIRPGAGTGPQLNQGSTLGTWHWGRERERD